MLKVRTDQNLVLHESFHKSWEISNKIMQFHAFVMVIITDHHIHWIPGNINNLCSIK